jgi:hypothetical protein
VGAALAERRRREADAKDRDIEQFGADVAKKSRIIAEVIDENLEMKKRRAPRCVWCSTERHCDGPERRRRRAAPFQ